MTRKGLQKAAQEQFERGQLLGEVQRREAANTTTFGNAIDALLRSRILGPAPDGGSARDPAYVRGDAFDDLVGMRERLASALLSR